MSARVCGPTLVPGGSRTWKRSITDGDAVRVEMSVKNEMQQT